MIIGCLVWFIEEVKVHAAFDQLIGGRILTQSSTLKSRFART